MQLHSRKGRKMKSILRSVIACGIVMGMILSSAMTVMACKPGPRWNVTNIDYIKDPSGGFHVTFNSDKSKGTGAYYSHVMKKNQATSEWLKEHAGVWVKISSDFVKSLIPQITMASSDIYVVWGTPECNVTVFYYVASVDNGATWTLPQVGGNTTSKHWNVRFNLKVDDDGLLSVWWKNQEQLLISAELDGDGIPDDLQQVEVDKDVTGATLLASDRLRVGIANVLNATDLSSMTVMESGIVFQNLTVKDWGYTTEIGKPKIPVLRKYVAVPYDAEIIPTVFSSSYDVLNDYYVYPVPEPALAGNETVPMIGEQFAINETFYATDAFYPENQVSIAMDTYIRHYRVILLEISPIQFNPVTRELRVYDSLLLSTEFGLTGLNAALPQEDGADGGYFNDIFENLIINYGASADWGVIESTNPGPGEVFRDNPPGINPPWVDYLIIVHDDFYDNAKLIELAQWRADHNNFGVAMVKTSDIYNDYPGEMDVAVKQTIIDFYNMYDTAYVLLVGDVNDVPTHELPGNWVFEYYGYGPETTTSDNWYVDILGDDGLYGENHLPDLKVGRLAGTDSNEITNLCDKCIRYESTPIIGSWRNNVLLTTGLDVGFLSVSMEAEKVYSQYLTPYDVNRAYYYAGANAVDIQNFIDEGQLIVDYLDHGWVGGWGYVGYTANHAKTLTNDGRWPVIFSMACQTGMFDYLSDCLGEAFVKNPNGGAVAFFGATENAESQSLRYLNNYIFENIFENEDRNVGNAIYYAKWQYGTSWPRNYEIEMYTLLGDPALEIATPRKNVQIQVQAQVEYGDILNIQGNVLNDDGSIDSMFDGMASIKILTPLYQMMDIGAASIIDGVFTSSKDITDEFYYGMCQVTAYVTTTQGSQDGIGWAYFDVIPQDVSITNNDIVITPTQNPKAGVSINIEAMVHKDGSHMDQQIMLEVYNNSFTWTNQKQLIQRSNLLDPCVLKSVDGYRMWCTDISSGNGRIILYKSPDGLVWSEYGVVVDIGGVYDMKNIWAPMVVMNSDYTFTMWYTGVDSINCIRILYATSIDGDNWVKCGVAIDIGTGNMGDNRAVYDPTVLLDGVVYKMWYVGKQIGRESNRLFYAESSDGIIWDKKGVALDVHPLPLGVTRDGYYDYYQNFSPTVVKSPSGVYYLWYGCSTRSFFATSFDGMHWQKWGNVIEWDWYESQPFTAKYNYSVTLENNHFKIWFSGIRNNINGIYSEEIPSTLIGYQPLTIDTGENSVNMQFDTTDNVGLHDVTVRIIPIKYVEPVDNNVASKPVLVGSWIDPYFENQYNIQFEPRWPYVGDDVEISATVRNSGDSDILSALVGYYDGNPSTGGIRIGESLIDDVIRPGESLVTSTRWSATSGEHEIFALIERSAPPEGSQYLYNNLASRIIYCMGDKEIRIPSFSDTTTSKVLEFDETTRTLDVSLQLQNKDVTYAIMDVQGEQRDFDTIPGSNGITIPAPLRPLSIAWSPGGELFVLSDDRLVQTNPIITSVRRYDGTGFTTIFSSPTSYRSIAFDSFGTLHLVKWSTMTPICGEIYKIPDLSNPIPELVLKLDGANGMPVFRANGLSFNEFGDMYVSGTLIQGSIQTYSVIKLIQLNPTTWSEVTSKRTTLSFSPMGIAVFTPLGSDELFVCDRTGKTILGFEETTTIFEEIYRKVMPYEPWSAAFGPGQQLWITEFPTFDWSIDRPTHVYEWEIPISPAIDVGDDGISDWFAVGRYGMMDTTNNYADAINSYISSHQSTVQPDGTITVPITFTTQSAGILSIPEIATIYYDDSILTPIATGITDQLMDLDWRPDASMCILVGNTATSPVAPIVMKYDGRQFTEVYRGPAAPSTFFRRVEWRPDGEYALIGSMGGKIYKYDPADNSVTLFYSESSDAYCYDISWQPDMNPTVPGYQGLALFTTYGSIWPDYLMTYDGSTFSKTYSSTYGKLRHGQWKPDGSYAVVTCSDGTAYKFDGALAPVASSAPAFMYPYWHPDGSACLMLAHDKIYIYDGTSITMKAATPGGMRAYGIDWYKPGGFYLLTSDDGQMMKYFPDSNTFLTVDGGVPDKLYGTEWRPNDVYSLVIGEDGNVFKYTAPLLTQIPTSSSLKMRDLDWSPDGSECLFIGNSLTSPVVNVLMKYETATSTFTTLYEISSTPSSYFMKIKWCPDGNYAIIGSMAGRLYKYSDAGGLELLAVPPGYQEAIYWDISWQPDNNPATPQYEGLAIITARNPWGDFIMTYDGTAFSITPMGTSGQSHFVSWRHDGAYAIVTTSLGTAYGFDGDLLWQFQSDASDLIVPYWLEDDSRCLLLSHTELYIFDSVQEKVTLATATPGGITGYSLAWYELGGFFMITCDNGQMLKYFPESNKFISIDSGVQDKLYASEFKPCDNYAFVIGEEGRIYRYVEPLINQLPSMTSIRMWDMDWRPDGSYCLLVGNAQTSPVTNVIWTFDGTDFQLIYSGETALSSFFRAVEWCPDGSYALITSMGGRIYKYDAVTGQVDPEFYSLYEDRGAYYYDLSWQPDTTPLTPDYDGTVLVTAHNSWGADFMLAYDGMTFTKTYLGTISDFYHVEWRHDGVYALVTSSEGGAYIFDGSILTAVTSAANDLLVPYWYDDDSKCLLLSHDNIYLYDPTTESVEYLCSTPGHIRTYSADWNEVGGYFLISCQCGQMLRYSPSGQTLTLVDCELQDNLYVTEWAPGGGYALVLGLNGNVYTYK